MRILEALLVYYVEATIDDVDEKRPSPPPVTMSQLP
jgi:hypothetical protein